MVSSNRVSRQGRVLALVQENTQQALEREDAEGLGIHAGTISRQLQMDRSNVARELNSLYRTGQVIKVQGKPTLYICRSTLARKYPNTFFPSTMPKGSSLEDYLTVPTQPEIPDPVSTATSLETRVGVHLTLRSAILRAKAAVMYPSHDLHTLITGSVGVGKAQFAREMYDHAVRRGSLEPDAPFITVNCREHNVSPQLLLNQLFGYARDAAPKGEKSRRGLIERAAGGFLCLNGVENLPPIVQDALITLLEKNTYTRMGEASVVRYANAMIVAISTESPDSESMQALSQRFPVQIHIPDLNLWSLRELAEILIQTFQKESISTGLSFRVSREALTVFLKASYPGNLGELSSVVRTTCALVFMDFDSAALRPKTMEINLRHLQPELLRSIREDSQQEARIQQLFQELDLEYLSFSPKGFSSNRFTGPQLLDLLHREPETLTGGVPLPPSLTAAMEVTREYFDTQTVPDRMPLSVLHDRFPEEFSGAIRRALESFPGLSGIADDPGSFFRLLSCLDDGARGALPQLDNDRSLRLRLQGACPTLMACAEAVCGAMERPFSDSDRVYLGVCLYMLRSNVNPGGIPILAVFHGQGIAEAMAEYVNVALGAPLVTGISDQVNMPFDQLLESVCATARRIHRGQGILLAVDMEPLTDLHKYLYETTGIPAETVSNVSLPTLLTISKKAQREDITLRELAQASQVTAGDSVPESSFLGRTVNEVLAPSLTFLNPWKAIDVLQTALADILGELNVTQSSEIAIKFVFHCSHMLERLIRGEVLRYDGLKIFVNRYSDLMSMLEKHMRGVAEIFGVSIPPSELAYIADILVPYLR